MKGAIVTNEWASVSESYPPSGRVVLAVVDHVTWIEYAVVKWNGERWLDGNHNVVTPFLKGANITQWYIFEKYFPKGDE
jgi:hypothetical protein